MSGYTILGLVALYIPLKLLIVACDDEVVHDAINGSQTRIDF